MNLLDSELCIRCKGKGWCKKPCRIYSKIKDFTPKTKTHFSGNSPPEIFIGRHNYPYVNAGILSPETKDEIATEEYGMPEIWHKERFTIDRILSNRGKLVYGRFKTEVKKIKYQSRFVGILQEIGMAEKPVLTEFFLKKPPKKNLEMNKYETIIANPAPLENIRLEENPVIKPKVDYIVSDTDAKSLVGIKELYKENIPISNISKILSAGLLGLKQNRKLVPTRWSITAVDDSISKELLKKIRYYKEIDEILLFNSNYNGNYYEIILLPGKYSFEVIEAEMNGSLWNQTDNISIMKDIEFFNGRKDYASNVTGAYYANRLALNEYLEKIKKQAEALFLRLVTPEYYAPLGVGILREICREAFSKPGERFDSIEEALNVSEKRLKIPIKIYKENSMLLSNYKKQKRLSNWF